MWVSIQSKTHRHSKRHMDDLHSEVRIWVSGSRRFTFTAVFNVSSMAVKHLGKCYLAN